MKRAVARTPRGRPRSFEREAALERAMQLFWRRGYAATSISDLTSAMGINSPSLYAAFGDKETLFLEAVDRYRSGPGGGPARCLEGEGTARDAVARLLEETAIELTRSGRPPGCMVVMAAMTCAPESARVQASLAKHRASTEAKIRTRIERGIRDGELRTGTDVRALARFYLTVVQGMSIQARDGATRRSLLATGATAMRAWPQ